MKFGHYIYDCVFVASLLSFFILVAGGSRFISQSIEEVDQRILPVVAELEQQALENQLNPSSDIKPHEPDLTRPAADKDSGNLHGQLVQPSNSLSDLRRGFLRSQKQRLLIARRWGMILAFLVAIGMVSGAVAYHHLLKVKREVELKAINSSRLASLGEMAGGIAHEINNPLAIVAGYTELSIEGLSRGAPKDLDKAIYRMRKSLKALSRIKCVIQSLKEFSRDGSQEPKELISLKDLVEDALALSSEKVFNKHISVEVAIEEELHIYANKTELAQVVMNLVSNSIYAVKLQDHPWIRIEGKSEGEKVRLSFIDSGSGIESHIVEEITKPFFTTKPVGEGTGLGLSISFGIVKNHNATMSYDSSCENTKFDILFPLAFEIDSDSTEVTAEAA